jgi:DNA polymerase-4
MDLLDDDKHGRWRGALAAADRLRDKFGESAVGLAAGMRGKFRERTHENPAGIPGRRPQRGDTEDAENTRRKT